MSVARAYLDHNATAPLRPEAHAAVVAALDVAGNPSSVHAEGRAARAVIDAAREEVAALAGARPAEVIFTSGATESLNWVLAAGWDTIVHAAIEHDAVRTPAARSGAAVVETAAGRDGVVAAEAFADALLRPRRPLGEALVAIQLANNETGVVQPAGEIAAFARAHGAAVLVDAVQAAGRIAIDCRVLEADYLALSGHKIGGPKGVGALIVRSDRRPRALIAGGGQEWRMRAGTENVAGIAGFGAAAAAARRDLADMARVAALRDRLEAGIRASTPDAAIVGADAPRLANTTLVALPGASAEHLVIALDLAGIAASSGAACSSGRVGESHVLKAMGLTGDGLGGAVRLSLGWSSREDDIDMALAAWREIAGRRVGAAAA